MTFVFFGSTADSVTVISRLSDAGFVPAAVITQPPRPVGRHHIITKTPVELWATSRSITVLSFESEPEKPWLYRDPAQVTEAISTFNPDLLITASYGQKIPAPCITNAKLGGVNIHPSLLPRFRGADPIPWTILAGDRRTGVSVVELADTFDEGAILGQKTVILTGAETSGPLRSTLFAIGAEMLVQMLPDVAQNSCRRHPQRGTGDAMYARKLSREHGFVPWEILQRIIRNEQARITGDDLKTIPVIRYSRSILDPQTLAEHPCGFLDRMIRGLSPWPGVHTIVPTRKGDLGLKILSISHQNGTCLPEAVQLAGKNPVSYSQFSAAYLV
jgi:methionyl-tRNA formyltransferase